MAKHLPGKISKLISDFLTIVDLTELIQHEMEKRMVARHGLIKLDAILKLTPRHKNELKGLLPNGAVAVKKLEAILAQLRKDYDGSGLATGRDAMSAHALNLDLQRIVDTWSFMNMTTFGVLASDLSDLDQEFSLLDQNYPKARSFRLEKEWQDDWATDALLGPPTRPRMAIIYGGLATAGIVSAIPGGTLVQDATIRVSGLMTFIHQLDRLIAPLPLNCEARRILSEIYLIDFCAMWEALFTSGVKNEHGIPVPSMLEQWRADAWNGITELETLEQNPHPEFQIWRKEIRDRIAAHLDPDIDIWMIDMSRWPMKFEDLRNEAYRVINAIVSAARDEIRARVFFMPPTSMGDDVIGLAAQEGRHWDES